MCYYDALSHHKQMNFMQNGIFSKKSKQVMTMDFILENISRNYYYQLPKNISNYIANNACELLDIALNISDITNPIKNNKSIAALLILSNSPKSVMDKLLYDGRFLVKSTSVLGQLSSNLTFNIEKELVSRIALIFINIIIKTNDKELIIDSIGFLTQMIHFIEDDTVLNFFLLFVSYNNDFKEMQNYLSQVNLYQFLINELTNDDENNFEKERNICIFIKNCLKNPILHKSFQKAEILNALIEIIEKRKKIIFNVQKQQIDLGDIKVNTINEICEVLSLLICPTLSTKMKPLISLSIEIVKNFYDSIQKCMGSNNNLDYYAHLIIRKYHVCLLDIISKIIVLKSNIINSNDHEILINTIKRIIYVFPNSTNLIIAAFRIVKSSLFCKIFAKKMIDALMPLLISLAKSNIRTASSAAATHFLADMDLTKNSNKMINDFLTKNHQYMAFYNASFKSYLEKAYVPYGGPVTVFKNKNIKIIRVKKNENANGLKNSIETK